jgi:hypothetical protein
LASTKRLSRRNIWDFQLLLEETYLVHEKLCTKVNYFAGGGPERKPSSAGREVPIKAVMQAIPTYPMSCFKLSKSICKKMTTTMSRFWWGGEEDKQKMHWRKWNDIPQPKKRSRYGV